MCRVSIILPVYNVSAYLEECLDSIVNQTLEDIEVICINDGSTDDSLLILERYAKSDERIKIYSQTNMGAGASRNRGISLAKGEYVYFADSDDHLDLNALEDAYDVASEKSVDFLMFIINNFYEDSTERIDEEYYNMPYLKDRVGDDTFNYEDVSDMALDLCVCPPGNLFSRDFIQDIRFPEGLLFEDNVFFTHALFKAENVYFYDKKLYNRRKRLDSTTTPISVKSLDTIEITNMLIDLCVEFGHENHKRELYYRIFHNIYQIFKKADKSQKPEIFEKIKQEYSNNREKWEKDDYFKNDLNPYYRHMFDCALSCRNHQRFEKCVDSYNETSLKEKFKRLKDRIL